MAGLLQRLAACVAPLLLAREAFPPVAEAVAVAECRACVAGEAAAQTAEMEELEEIEVKAMRTELLQVRLEHSKAAEQPKQASTPYAWVPARRLTPMDSAEAEAEGQVNSTGQRHNGKVWSDTLSWCAQVGQLVQNLVPPCLFGSLDVVQDAPGSNPDWCKYVPVASKEYVAACSPAGLLESGPDTFPDWCKNIPAEVRRSVAACNPAALAKAQGQLLSMPTQAELVGAEGKENVTMLTFHGKVRADSPSWCADVNEFVQSLVPPCSSGSPDVEKDIPSASPDWCKYLPVASKEDVAACSPAGRRQASR